MSKCGSGEVRIDFDADLVSLKHCGGGELTTNWCTEVCGKRYVGVMEDV